MKKILAAVLAAIMIALLLPVMLVPASADSLWDGTETDIAWYNTTDTTFTINTAAQLAGLAKIVNGYVPEGTPEGQEAAAKVIDTFKDKTVKLGADIDLNNKFWTPIAIWQSATTIANEFQGTFDGQDHTISNLYCFYTLKLEDGETDMKTVYGVRFGLFGFLSGTVCNLKFVGADIENTSGHYSGVVAGIVSGGKVENVYIDATSKVNTTHGTSQGAVCGRTENNAVLSNIENHADVIGIACADKKDDGTYKLASSNILNGGIVGMATDTTIKYCRNYGKVVASDNGEVTMSQTAAGGIVGFIAHCTVQNCVNYGEIQHLRYNEKSGGGGIAGAIHKTDGTITGCYNFGKVTGIKEDRTEGDATFTGIIVGNAKVTVNITDCFALESGDEDFIGSSSPALAGSKVNNTVKFKETDTNFDALKEAAAKMLENALKPQYTLTINYVYAADNSAVADSITGKYYEGDNYSFSSPVIQGYEPTDANLITVAGVMGTEDVTVNVVYAVKNCTVTIEYVFEDGKTAAETKTVSGDYGTEFSVDSPAVDGYAPNFEKVSGKFETNRTITVKYKASAVATTPAASDDTTAAPAADTTPAPATTAPAKSGCGSVSIAAVAAAIIAAVGTAVIIKKH